LAAAFSDVVGATENTRTHALDAAALTNLIDQGIQKQLDGEKLKASPRADDAEFLRRVYLDITGVIPSADKAAAFLSSKDPNKRAKLIDELLSSSRYGRHMADIWQALLLSRTSDNRRLDSEPLVQWLEKAFNDNKTWDRLVAELMTATGKPEENGAVVFFIANPTSDKLTDLTSKLFLGVQLQCAQCHNHPFTHWKQTEYWGMAAFFSKVKMNANAKQAAKMGIQPEVGESNKGKAPKLPESAKIVPARFFQGEEPQLSSSEPYRPVLARWMTSPANPFFARAIVNRLWLQFFGRGFVQPVDDMHEGNVPSHPELLKTLSNQFAAGGFDLKNLIRAICNSQTYQRTSKPFGSNDKDTILLSHMPVKALTPEQLFDSLTAVVDAADQPKEGKKGKAAKPAPKGGNGNKKQRANFVAFFQTDDAANPTEYPNGIPQVLRLMNSPQFSGVNSPVVNQLAKTHPPASRIADQLCLTALSRHPTPAEAQRWTAYLTNNGDNRKAASDLLWALLNSSEFSLNH
jgi:hypothetical protein